MTRSDTEEIHYEDITSSNTKTLLMLQTGHKGIITRIVGGHSANKRLSELGLVPGVEIVVANKISKGPIMIRVKGSKLALGRGIANKIEVKIIQ